MGTDDVTTRRAWLAGLAAGDEVAIVSADPSSDWAFIDTIVKVTRSCIYVRDTGGYIYFLPTTGDAPTIYCKRLVPVTPELRARAAHAQRAERLGVMYRADWAKLPPALVEQVTAMIDKALEG